MTTETATNRAAGDALRVASPEVAGATRAMFLSSASASPMLRGPTITYSPDESGGGGGEAGDGGEDTGAAEGEGAEGGGEANADQDNPDADGGDGGEEGEGEDNPDAQAAEDEFEEIEHEGAKHKIPKALKPLVMMQKDYTQKTQAHAEEVRNWQQQRAQQAESLKALTGDYGRVTALQERVALFEKVDWDAERAADPDQWRELRDDYMATKDKLNDAVRDLRTKEEARLEEADTELRSALKETGKVLARDIKDWSPALADKLVTFAGQFGVTREELARQPDARVWKLLHAAFEGTKVATRQATVQRQQAVTQAKPAAPIRGAAPVSGPTDRQSTEEWMRRRNAEAAKARR